MRNKSVDVPTVISNDYRNYVLFILTLTYAFNFIEHEKIDMLLLFIMANLGLDDPQLGWVKAICYVLCWVFLSCGLLTDTVGSYCHHFTLSLEWSYRSIWFSLPFHTACFARIGEAVGSRPSHPITSVDYTGFHSYVLLK
jgi:hypothetical protein